MQWNEEIKEKRLEYKAGQDKVAMLLGVSRTYYNLLENGKRQPSDDLKRRLEIVIEKFNPKYMLYALYDYVRVRFPTHEYKEIINDVLKMNFKYFINEDYGFYGYKEQFCFADIVVMVSEEDGQRGTLLELKGKGCRRLEYILQAQNRTWNDFFIDCLSKNGVIKRLDIAINDTAGILSIPELSKKTDTLECRTIFNSFQIVTSGETLKREIVDDKIGIGNTLYIGSVKSDIYFCIYEKDYEQYKKEGIPIEDADVKNRFEIRLKNDRAFLAVMDLINFDDMEKTAFEIINRYLCFHEKEDKKKPENWKVDYRWSWFMGNGRDKLRLTMQPEPYTIDKSYRWILKQVAPTLSLLRQVDEFNRTSFIREALYTRLPEKQRKIYEQYVASIEDVACWEEIEEDPDDDIWATGKFEQLRINQ